MERFEYYIQKHNISPQELYENGFDEDCSEMKNQLNSMGNLGWELCGVVPYITTPDAAKFIYKRNIEPFDVEEELQPPHINEENIDYRHRFTI